MKKLLSVFILLSFHMVFGQSTTQKVNLKNATLWTLIDKPAPIWKDTIVINKTEAEGMMLLKDFEMTNGIIEFDLKGQNLAQQSFLGIAFNVQDAKTYEHVYFRPFNFMNADTARRNRAVQYASLPDSPWPKLREAFPGKYEHKVNPVPDPDGWFHARVVIERPFIRVYINNNTAPGLVIESLAPTRAGKVGLWTGPSTIGSFTNLIITPTDKN